MQRIALTKMKTLLLREGNEQAERHWQYYGKLARAHAGGGKSKESFDLEKTMDSSNWIPHPRSGIYFPEGHEEVMEDVPAGAASFRETYWMRSVDGVETPSHDVPSEFYLNKDAYGS